MAKVDFENYSDEHLVELVKEQNEFAVEELFNRYRYIASSVAHSYFLNGGDSEDLLQEGLFAIFKAITSFNGKSSFKNYVYTCVKNRIFTLIKSSNRNKHVPLNNYISLSSGVDGDGDTDKSEIIIDNKFAPEEVYINSESVKELEKIINETLSEYEHKILLEYLKGYSYREISVHFSKKEKSIDNAIQRIRKKILNSINLK